MVLKIKLLSTFASGLKGVYARNQGKNGVQRLRYFIHTLVLSVMYAKDLHVSIRKCIPFDKTEKLVSFSGINNM